MTVEAVVFDWGGTLTPWHDLDLVDLWLAAARVLAPDRSDELARALVESERAWWAEAERTGLSGTIDELVAAATAATGLAVDAVVRAAALAAHFEAFAPHTYTDPQAGPLLAALRSRGIRTGLLSNTHWPREVHERILERDGIADLIDVRVYTSELTHVKPHPEAFRAVLARLGVEDPAAAVFVGDRPRDDISGAKGVGMRAVLRPNTAVPGYDVEPDATISALSELLPLIDFWTTAATAGPRTQ